MKYQNISLGSNVEIDPSTSVNNVIIGDNVRIAKRCSIYGGPDNQLELGKNVYVGMNSLLNGYADKLIIGDNVSISQFVNIMVDSGPNASPGMLRLFPIIKGPISIGNDCWIGASSIIMPNVQLGEYCIVAANSFVNKSFPPYSIIGGSPARLIRSFSNTEKAILLNSSDEIINPELSHYEKNYIDLPFEGILREYRRNKILELIRRYPHDNFLEIGCGPDPLFRYISDFMEMTVVEPGVTFYKLAHKNVGNVDNVTVINNRIEDTIDILSYKNFDFLVIGGFLHEVTDPDSVLQAVRKVCSKDTVVFSFAPNARSFHRLWAQKSGLIDSVYSKSRHDDLFNRHQVYDIEAFNNLFRRNNYDVIESGTYFVKPFPHDLMSLLIEHGYIDTPHLNGLDKMVEYMPDMGAELWNICKFND